MSVEDTRNAATVESRLHALGHTLPVPPTPRANYTPGKVIGDKLYLSGQIPFVDEVLTVTGKLGEDVTVEEGQRLAALAALNALGAARQILGTLEGVSVANINVFVACASSFAEQHVVANGASDILTAAFGPDEAIPRTAVGVPGLPLNAPVEIQLLLTVSAA
ncbi:RidA family protein [Streptomyces prunicolor]|uniref:RidA family protein n=1 Tax=Streptomyces prunicolor TaxID=67348 RepID=UPI00371408F1